MHLTLYLTRSCNMRCSYCYASKQDGEPMSEETGRKALDMGARMTTGSCGIVFFGGEPLLEKDRIYYLIEYGRWLEQQGKGRFHFKITTNGTLLDDAFIEYSRRSSLLVSMSFDGIKDAHDRHRRWPDGHGTYDLLKSRLVRLLEASPYSIVMMLVNPDTAEFLCESVESLLALGCKYIIVSLNHKAPWQEADLKVLQHQLGSLGKRYVQWTLEGRKFYLSPFEVKLSSHINQHCHAKERCELAQKQISMAPDGFLYPCAQFVEAGPESEWCIGHIDTGIDEPRRKCLYEQSHEEKVECMDCSVKARCHNTCACMNWHTTGSVNHVSPLQCRYEQMMIPIADRVGRRLYRKRDPIFLHKHYNAAYPVLSLLEDTVKQRRRR